MTTNFITEPERMIPVIRDVDVVVAGGGTAGTAAAVTAAREGLSVVMLEQSAQPGGMVTHVIQWLSDFKTKGGFTREFLDTLTERGTVEWPYYNTCEVVPYFDELIAQSGAEPLYFATVAAPVVEDNRLCGVIIETGEGRQAIRGKVIIDATGDGHVAARAGADFRIGREKDGACQAVSISQLWTGYTGGEISRPDLNEIIAQAVKQTDAAFTLPYDSWGVTTLPGTDQCILCSNPHATGHDVLSAKGMSECLVELRQQALDIFTFFKENIPEFKDIEFGPFSALPGIRETRRICCDATITYDDLRTGSSFDDGLFTVEMNIDIHRCSEGEPAIYVERISPFQVPYRAMLPTGLENIIAAGRCISGDHEAMSSYRIAADCFAMGEAAALAAKLAVDKQCTLRNIDVAALVSEMKEREYV